MTDAEIAARWATQTGRIMRGEMADKDVPALAAAVRVGEAIVAAADLRLGDAARCMVQAACAVLGVALFVAHNRSLPAPPVVAPEPSPCVVPEPAESWCPVRREVERA